MSTRLTRRIVDKTASYTIQPSLDTAGTCFTNRGASGSVTFTLPTPTPALLGRWYQFLGIADQTIVVASATADTLITKNDLEADSVALSTSGEKIGGSIVAVCVRSADTTYKWLAYGDAVGHTYTVATA